MSMSSTVLHEQASFTLDMIYWYNAKLKLLKMEDQKSMMLHWCSFSEWCREHDALVFAPEGSQNLIYGCLHPITTWMMQVA